MQKPPKDFGTNLKPGQFLACILWKRDGSRASSIVIRKEIWLKRTWLTGEEPQYAAFFVYNHLDPDSTIPNSGCCVTPHEKPILELKKALRVARRLEGKVRASRKWVDVTEVRRPRIHKPKDGIWAFNDLMRVRKVDAEEFVRTFEHYASCGAAINPDVVISIKRRTELSDSQRARFITAAHVGAHNQSRHPRSREEYLLVSRS